MHRVTVLTLLVVLLGGLLVAPAAARPPEVPDERISLFECDWVEPPCIFNFPAETPFWISQRLKNEHGQGINMKGVAPAAGHNDFKLYFDGVEVEADWTFHSETLATKLTTGRGLWLFVFPEGLAAGEHVFFGEWYGTCSIADIGVVEGCDRPSDPLIWATRTLTVNFY